jgi:hypothetical protein
MGIVLFKKRTKNISSARLQLVEGCCSIDLVLCEAELRGLGLAPENQFSR